MKGISPLVASVLLIAITMAIAAILANYISGLTQQTIGAMQTCIGGSVNFASAEYPKWSDSTVIAVVEAQGVALGNFKFSVTLTNDTVLTYDDVTGHSIPPGAVGDIRTSTLPFSKSQVKSVLILTNCSNVKAGPTTLR
ncbi:MAG: archaellin/type IV pilin N-terminal domain-containing protein [Candidatus Aenigmatarchaeota archaeon]